MNVSHTPLRKSRYSLGGLQTVVCDGWRESGNVGVLGQRNRPPLPRRLVSPKVANAGASISRLFSSRSLCVKIAINLGGSSNRFFSTKKVEKSENGSEPIKAKMTQHESLKASWAKKRQDPVFMAQYREKTKASWAQRKKDPVYMANLRERREALKAKKMQDPAYLVQIAEQREALAKKRQDSEYMARITAKRKATWAKKKQDPVFMVQFSEKLKAFWAEKKKDPVFMANHRAKSKNQDPEFPEKMRRRMNANWEDLEYQARHSQRMKKSWLDPGYKAKRVDGLLKKWKDEDFRARRSGEVWEQMNDPDMIALKRQYMLELWKDPKTRINLSRKMKAKWQDPAHREKMRIAWQRVPRKSAERDRIIRPSARVLEMRKMFSKLRSERLKSDPESKRKMLRGLRRLRTDRVLDLQNRLILSLKGKERWRDAKITYLRWLREGGDKQCKCRAGVPKDDAGGNLNAKLGNEGTRSPRNHYATFLFLQKKWTDPQYRENMTLALVKHWSHVEHRRRQAEIMKEFWTDPDFRTTRASKIRTVRRDRECRSRILKTLRKRWHSPSFKIRLLSTLVQARQEVSLGDPALLQDASLSSFHRRKKEAPLRTHFLDPIEARLGTEPDLLSRILEAKEKFDRQPDRQMVKIPHKPKSFVHSGDPKDENSENFDSRMSMAMLAGLRNQWKRKSTLRY